MKKIFFLTLSVLVVLLIVAGGYSIMQNWMQHREMTLEARQAMLNKEDFRGLTIDQIEERFGWAHSYQNIPNIIDEDGTFHEIDLISYTDTGMYMEVYLDNRIVAAILYVKFINNKRVFFAINGEYIRGINLHRYNK